jgi:L-methionine (R)-S-oxide reductase
MAEDFTIQGTTKEEKYISLLPQIKALVEGENDETANLANIAAALKQTFDFFWVGFYLVKNNELVLGPFQGPVACTRIGLGKGVCGASWKDAQTIIVDDVDKFPGHIACSSASKSEIVVPIYNKDKKVVGVLDVDDDKYAMFDATDKLYLEQVAALVTGLLGK